MARKAGKRRGKPGKRPAEVAPVSLVSGLELAKYLFLSRAAVEHLQRSGVFSRAAGDDGQTGFDRDQARKSYIEHLRSKDDAPSARSEAETVFQQTKNELLTLQLMKKRGELMHIEDALAVIDMIGGSILTAIGSLPARIAGQSIPERRRIELITNAVQDELCAAAQKHAKASNIRMKHWLRENPDYQESPPLSVGGDDDD